MSGKARLDSAGALHDAISQGFRNYASSFENGLVSRDGGVEGVRGVLSVVMAFVMVIGQAGGPAAVQEIERSQIQANVPAAANFHRLLQRNLRSYFQRMHGKKLTVEYEMLRDGPTQSGAAYPMFYVWVRVLEARALLEQGAARLAAIARKEFQVTHFLSEQAIRDEPGSLYRVFPAPVCKKIETKLGIE